jgi:hypothetical protein
MLPAKIISAAKEHEDQLHQHTNMDTATATATQHDGDSEKVQETQTF